MTILTHCIARGILHEVHWWRRFKRIKFLYTVLLASSMKNVKALSRISINNLLSYRIIWALKAKTKGKIQSFFPLKDTFAQIDRPLNVKIKIKLVLKYTRLYRGKTSSQWYWEFAILGLQCYWPQTSSSTFPLSFKPLYVIAAKPFTLHNWAKTSHILWNAYKRSTK